MKITELTTRKKNVSVALDTENQAELWEQVQKNCSQAIEAFFRYKRLYKGLTLNEYSNIFLADPSRQYRKSVTTTNHYSLLFNNLPAWKGFPKRSRSLICTTDVDGAENYGEPYLILPFDNAKIAVCPTHDIWVSFPKIIPSLRTFNYFLHNHDISDKSFQALIETSLEQTATLSAITTEYWYQSSPAEKKQIAEEFLDADSTTDILKIYNTMFDPIAAGFWQGGIQQLPKLNKDLAGVKIMGNEAWTDSKSYMIRRDGNFYRQYLMKL